MFSNTLIPLYFDNGKKCDFKTHLEDYYIKDFTQEWLNHNIKLKNDYINGCIIYTNLFDNYNVINNLIKNDILVISNNIKIWKNNNVLQYKCFYKLLKKNINLKEKIIVLDNPSPNNSLLRNIKSKFIIIFTSSIYKPLFRIIINGYISNELTNNMIYKYLLRNKNKNNKFKCETINVKPNIYDKLFNKLLCKINYINIYNIKKIKIYKEDFCPTCFELNPDIFFKCGHNFCLTCIEKIIKNDSCPMCRSAISGNTHNSFNLFTSNKDKSNKLKSIKKFIKENKNNNILFFTNDKFEKQYFFTFFEKHKIIRKFININNSYFDFSIMNYIITSNIPDEDYNYLINYLEETQCNFDINKIKFIKFI
jgi:hypothetical protein